MTDVPTPPQPVHTVGLQRGWIWLAVGVVVLLGALPVADPDAIMHATIGRWMLQHASLLPTPDPLVWTDLGGDRQHEWLAQLAIGGVVETMGLGGLRLFGGVLAGACAWLLAEAARRQSLRPAWQIAVVLVWAVLAEPHLAPRPHLLGWAMAIAVLGFGLTDPRPWRGPRALAWLTLLAVWANLHSSVLIAVAYSGLAWLSASWRARRIDREMLARLGVCTAGTLLQPQGPMLVPYILKSQGIGASLSEEWLPLLRGDVWHDRPAVLLVWAVLAVAVAWLWGLRRDRDEQPTDTTSFPSLLPVAFALVHAAITRRMAPFLFVTALGSARRLHALRLDKDVAAWAVTACAGLALLPHLPAVATPRAVRAGAFPEVATAFLAETRPQGRLFNPDPWGGWLAWNLHPPQQIFLDGRLLLGGEAVVRDLIALQVRGPGSQTLFDRYKLEIFMQRTGDYLQAPPPDPQHWKLAWRDDQAVVLLRDGPHWQANLAQVCNFYRDRPALHAQAQWPRKLRGPPGVPTPTDVPSILTACPP